MNIFSALAVPTRLSIIEILASQGRLSAREIGRHFSITASAVSQHLRVLIESDLLVVERRAQQRIYEINPTKISEVEKWAANTVHIWQDRLNTLDKVLENNKSNNKL